MSIYDDLADSSYMGKDQFRMQLQANSQIDSANGSGGQGSNQMLRLNDLASSEGPNLARQEENFSHFGMGEFAKDPYGIHRNSRQVFNGQSSQQNYKESQVNYNLQYSSNNQPSIDSQLLISRVPLQDAGRLAKDDLLSKRRMFGDDIEDDIFQRDDSHRFFEDDVIHLQANINLNTGKFPVSQPVVTKQQNPIKSGVADVSEFEQYKKNNDQLQKVLMQLQIPAKTQQHQLVPSYSQFEANFRLPQFNQASAFNVEGGSQGRPLNNESTFPKSQASGPHYIPLNKENSILEIARMQNSNGSQSDNYHNQSMIDRDFLQAHQKDQSPRSKNFDLNLGMLNPRHSSVLLESESMYVPVVNAYQQQKQPHQQRMGGLREAAQVSDHEKENYNSHNMQFVPASAMINHSKTASNLHQLAPQAIKYPDVVVPSAATAKTVFFNEKHFSEKELKKREIMDKFDDIPIKELNKTDGYQAPMMQETSAQDEGEPGSENLSLIEKIESEKWKIRMKAYKEIGELFYVEYSRQCQQNENDMRGRDEMDTVNPFEQYGPFLQKIISDSNLIAQFEGLNCLFAYVRFATDIKQVVFMVHAILLEKIQVNKLNFREITLKILLQMIRRDKSQSVVPELIRRFKNKNVKIASFSMEAATEGLRNQLLLDEANLRTLFKTSQINLGHTNKEVRDTATELIKTLYALCSDDVHAFSKNFTSLRPIQLKEIKDILQDIEKSKTSELISLFQKEQYPSSADGHTPKKQKTKIDTDQNFAAKAEKHNSSGKKLDLTPEQLEVDLLSMIPENFAEIPYLTQINTKKKSMEAFNAELEKLIQRKNRVLIANKDYTLIFNVVTHMLEDSNALVFIEAIKTVEFLSLLMGKMLKSQKTRQFIALLTDKYKETKTQTVHAVNKALTVLLKRQSIPTVSLIDYLVCSLAHGSKNPRVKQLILEKTDQVICEEVESGALKEEDLLQVFKICKEKLIGLIQKDTNANVRDAAVLLLTSFKAFLFDNEQVSEAIAALPKYRITEINKQASERKRIQVQSSSSTSRVFKRPVSAKDDIQVILPPQENLQEEQNILEPVFKAEPLPPISDFIPAQPQPKSIGETIVEFLDLDFERGLLLLKQSAQSLSQYDFTSKELILQKLLLIVFAQCRNPQEQQYRQAYALKAALWMREEIFGLEDAFRAAWLTLRVFGQAQLDRRENSVELYLINQWVREFTLRDLIDRIAQVSNEDEKLFTPLFAWLSSNKLGEEKWIVEDFRKISLFLGKGIAENQQIQDFFIAAVAKQGARKVSDFMEIQLMHNQKEYNRFIKWFSSQFEQQKPIEEAPNHAKVPPIKPPSIGFHQEELKITPQTAKFDDQELRNALASPFPTTGGEYSQPPSARPQSTPHHQQQQSEFKNLYRQLREQRKHTNQRKVGQEPLEDLHLVEHKYDQIISRLEAQLQTTTKGTLDIIKDDFAPQKEHIPPPNQHQNTEDEKPRTRSTDLKMRYQQVMMADEEDPISIMREPEPPSSISKQEQLRTRELEEVEEQLKRSSIKEFGQRERVAELEMERQRNEIARQRLLEEKNQESLEWQARFERMNQEHKEIARNLHEANRSYLQQVGENEDLRSQIKLMQTQHTQMMEKLAEFEDKLMRTTNAVTAQGAKVKVVSDDNLKVLEQTFTLQILNQGQNDEAQIKRIQELLLNFTNQSSKVSSEDMGDLLYVQFSSLKSLDQRFNLVRALNVALERNEDVLFALPHGVYRSLLDFNLRAFGQEKAALDERMIRGSLVSGSKNGEQNEVTTEIQKVVSKLLNSKEFTTSLVSLFEILRQVMPEDLSQELTSAQRQHLRVLMRCVSRICKALPSEQADLVRAFDVLLEMQKLFHRSPPEALREDLPSLEDFDLIYRGLKDVADRMMELQPEKTRAFLEFVGSATDRARNENAFIKYMRQVMGMNLPSRVSEQHQDQCTYDQEDDY